jgi:hypothetical protein
VDDFDLYSARIDEYERRTTMDDEGQSGQRGNIGTEIFEQVERIMSEEGLSRTSAFQRLSELTGRRAGTVAANYYRVARQRGATLAPRAPRGSKPRATSAPRPSSPRSGGGADAALARAMESLQELAGIVRQQEKELAGLRVQAEQVEKLKGLLNNL